MLSEWHGIVHTRAICYAKPRSWSGEGQLCGPMHAEIGLDWYAMPPYLRGDGSACGHVRAYVLP